MIDKSSIEELRQRADIVDIISSYVELRKNGANYVGVCPFHQDKNPSMSVSAIKGFYHCFACKAGGDVFKFVQDYERISFNEAVEKVAHLSNFSLRYTDSKEYKTNKNLKNILPMLNAFYKDCLVKHKEALAYLYSRSLNDDDIRKFELGFAPSSSETLELLKKEQIPLSDALAVGAVKLGEDKNYYAAFSKRISFPIYDAKGFLVGFGARIIDGSNRAKYINSAQNILFDKSRIFYALNLARDEIKRKKQIIICEGYLDVIAFHRIGLCNAVAVLGTALTPSHINIIKRLEAEVLLCFDSDEAGLKAAARSSFLLSLAKMEGKVCFISGGKDVAELVFSSQEKKVFEIFDKGYVFDEFYIRHIISNFDLSNITQKQKALEAVQEFSFQLDPLIAQHYEILVSNLLNVSRDFVNLSRTQKKAKKEKISIFKEKPVFVLAEAELCKFLYENKHYKDIFFKISNENFFIMKETLNRILQDAKNEDVLIRELEMKDLSKLKGSDEFLSAICKINYSFFSRQKQTSLKQALKKQALNALDKKSIRLKKELSKKDFFNFLYKNLCLINEDEDIVKDLSDERYCKELEKLIKFLARDNFKTSDFLDKNDEPF